MTDSHSNKNLYAALVAFQAELPDVSKGGTNPAFKSKYATLPDVTKAVFPVLAKHGLAFTCLPDDTPEGPVLRWQLAHVTGEVLSGVWGIPDGIKAQEVGSWITYGRRYILGAVTGVTPDEDDDGNRATTARVKRPAAAERIAAAHTAVAGAGSLRELHDVWGRVQAGGLDGVAELVTAHEARKVALAGTETPGDVWAAR